MSVFTYDMERDIYELLKDAPGHIPSSELEKLGIYYDDIARGLEVNLYVLGEYFEKYDIAFMNHYVFDEDGIIGVDLDYEPYCYVRGYPAETLYYEGETENCGSGIAIDDVLYFTPFYLGFLPAKSYIRKVVERHLGIRSEHAIRKLEDEGRVKVLNKYEVYLRLKDETFDRVETF